MSRVVRHIWFIFILGVVANVSYANMVVPFQLINGLIVVEAEINGTTGNYIMDSGSNGILLNKNSEKSVVSYQTLNSTLEGSETTIKSFKVGDFELKQLLGFSTDLTNLEAYLNKPLAGILGCSIFVPNALSFDFINSTIVISEKSPEKLKMEGLTCLAYTVTDDLPIVELIIEGNNYAFILDTGASTHFIEGTLLNKIARKSTGVEKSIVTAGGEDQISKEFFIENCKIGNLDTTIRAFEKDFRPISETLGKDISGLLSLSKLSPKMVYFDLKAKKIYYN